MGNNRKRIVAKSRLDILAAIINKSANEARDIHDFKWMVEDRVKASVLPKRYHEPTCNQTFIFQMYQRYQRHGCCINPDELRILERAINEPDSN
jgi:hypothetical protein